MIPPTSVPSVNWLSSLDASRPWSVWRTHRDRRRFSATSTAAAHLWGGETQFLEHVWGHWRDRGYNIQLALADSVGAAWAFAHTAPFSVIPAGEAVSALSRLPLETLRLPATVLGRLQTLGLVTIGEVLRLPRESLAARFGLLLTQRLDHALGLRSESFVSERLIQPLRVAREWEVPIDNRLNLLVLCSQMLRELLIDGGTSRNGSPGIRGRTPDRGRAGHDCPSAHRAHPRHKAP